MNRLLAALCTIAVVIGCVGGFFGGFTSSSVMADEGSGFTYEVLSNGTLRLTGCSLSGVIDIPSSINGKTVTELGSKLFYGREGITEINIPATIKAPGTFDYVFSYCYSLVAINVDPDNQELCSVDGVLFTKDKSTLYNYPNNKPGSSYITPAQTEMLCCTSFASQEYLSKLYLTNPGCYWMGYTFWGDPDLTVYYLTGGYSETRAQMFIDSGSSSDTDPNTWNTFAPIDRIPGTLPTDTPTPTPTNAPGQTSPAVTPVIDEIIYRWYFYDPELSVDDIVYYNTTIIDIDITPSSYSGSLYYTVSKDGVLLSTISLSGPTWNNAYEGMFGLYNGEEYGFPEYVGGCLTGGEYEIVFYTPDDKRIMRTLCTVINTFEEEAVTPVVTISTTPTSTPAPTTAPAGPTRVPATPTSMPLPQPTNAIPSRPTLIPYVSPTSAPTSAPSSNGDSGVEGFAERLYTCALGRASEPAGKAYWANELRHGATGASVAHGFFFSDELLQSSVSYEEYIYRLYRTFMNREPAASEVSYWTGLLYGNATLQDVFDGFINSDEWANICLQYGILSGGNGTPTITLVPSDAVVSFAERLYTTCLRRSGEHAGVVWWAGELANLRMTGSQAAEAYFFSDEFINARVSDREFINRLYLTFMDRNAASGEFDYWLNQMSLGMSRHDVFSGFAYSEEFGNICAEYGILR